MDRFAAAQPLLIGAILLWSSYGKLFGPMVELSARRTALARLVGKDRALPAYRVVGVLEALVAAILLLPPAALVDGVAATALGAGFCGYVGYARLAAPDSSCGCLGTKQAPVSWRSMARAGLMLLAGVAMLAGGTAWWSAVGAGVAGVVVALVAEAMVFVALSGELDRYWLRPLQRLEVRLTHPLGATAGSFEVPLTSTVQQLLRSPAYRVVGEAVRSDILDHWDEGDWRLLAYAATYENRRATAVFAVPRLRYDPDAVTVALVDDETGETLYKPEPLPVP